MLTLDDIRNLPNDPTPEHLIAAGLLPAPAPAAPVIPAVGAGTIPKPSPVNAPPTLPAWHANLAATTPKPREPLPPLSPVTAPDLATGTPEAQPGGINAMTIPQLPHLGFKERQALPLTSEGVAPNSKEEALAKLERLEDQKQNPWGSSENHPGLLGKIAHVAAKVGNIAGDIVAPATMANIPGTDLNKQIQEKQLKGEIAGDQSREVAGRAEETREKTEATREKHEENVEDFNEQRIKEQDKKIEADEKKHLSDREIALRKQGLKPDPKDDTKVIPIDPEEMSQTERDVHLLKAGQADAQMAKAALDKIKADPNSPQSQASLARIRVMAQNAATAAERLGLEKKKYLADYFGLDENLNPIAGTLETPEGKPIGPRIAGNVQKVKTEFNHNYEKPANDTERSYQLYQEALKAYNSGDTQTGASTMLALSQHIGTTFGQIKGSRMNKDLITEHKDAIGIEDRIERFAASLSRGDQLSASQMKEFGDQIHAFRNLMWQTSVKEAKRANLPVDFLPADLHKQMGGAGGGHPTEPPGPAAPGMKWQQNKKTGEFRQTPATP